MKQRMSADAVRILIGDKNEEVLELTTIKWQ